MRSSPQLQQQRMHKSRKSAGKLSARTNLLVQKANTAASPVLPEASQHKLACKLKDKRFRIQGFSSRTLPPELLDWAFQLVKDALQHLYEGVWGWKDKDKREQLKHPDSRFLIVWGTHSSSDNTARAEQAQEPPKPPVQPAPSSDVQPARDCDPRAVSQPDNDPAASEPCTNATQPQFHAQPASQQHTQATSHSEQPHIPSQSSAAQGVNEVPAAYLNYRFEQGYDKDPVLYVYELMVNPDWYRHGLATHLMGLAEDMAWEACMDKVVLTVMVTNTAARGLYEALGYTTDKASPSASEKAGYLILSRTNPSLQGTEPAKPKAKSGAKKK